MRVLRQTHRNMNVETCMSSRLKKLRFSKKSFPLVPPYPHFQAIFSSFPFLPKASLLYLFIHESHTLTTALSGERGLVANPSWPPHPHRTILLSTPVAFWCFP